MFGLQPKHFVWIIPKRVAVSERPGGMGKVHRRVRRDEELDWILHSPITRVLSLLGSVHNLDAYDAAGIAYDHVPIQRVDDALDKLPEIFTVLDQVMDAPDDAVLVHLDDWSDIPIGVVAAFLVHRKLVPSGPVAVALVERITGRPLGPEGRALVFAAD